MALYNANRPKANIIGQDSVKNLRLAHFFGVFSEKQCLSPWTWEVFSSPVCLCYDVDDIPIIVLLVISNMNKLTVMVSLLSVSPRDTAQHASTF